MDFIKLEKYLIKAIQNLPGKEAQYKMASKIRFDIENNTIISAQQAGVLILLFPYKNNIATVFIKRNSYPGPHSGQISFPGGKYEPVDKNIVNTALREANEEIGIDLNLIKVIGQISPLYIMVSNFNVVPVIAYTKVNPNFVIDKSEVEKIIVIKINDFYNPKNLSSIEFNWEKEKINAPCYKINNNIIWGATAMILSEFFEIMKDYFYNN